MSFREEYHAYHAAGEGRLGGDLLAALVGALAYSVQGVLLVLISVVVLYILGFLIYRKGWHKIENNPMKSKAEEIAYD